MRTGSIASGVVVAMVSVMMVACGGDDAESATADTSTRGAAQTAESTVIPASMQAFQDDVDVAEIVIVGEDMIRFNIDRFTVKPGQMVRLTLNHVGSLPAQAMGHNVTILNAGEVYYEFGADVGMEGGSAENEFVPESLRDRVIAFTEMIGGGESTTVEFQAPQEPGEYPFLCTFPGHFGQMNGVMVVE